MALRDGPRQPHVDSMLHSCCRLNGEREIGRVWKTKRRAAGIIWTSNDSGCRTAYQILVVSLGSEFLFFGEVIDGLEGSRGRLGCGGVEGN